MDVLESGKGKLICPPNPDQVRSYMRENKSYALTDKRMTHKEAISKFVKPNDYLGIELYGTVRCPLSLTREIVRGGLLAGGWADKRNGPHLYWMGSVWNFSGT